MVSHHPLTRAPERTPGRCERSVAKTKRWLLLFALLLFGCNPVSPSPTSVPVTETPQPPDTPTPAPDYITRIRNAEYQLGLTDALKVVQLTDGKFEQGAPAGTDYASITMTDFIASGDLDGDGVDEIAALVAENYGGSGVFVFLAVYKDVSGTPKFQTSLLVDDRPQLNGLSIENGEIFLNATTHKTDEPFCCPTLQTTRHYLLTQNGQLDMTDYTTFTPDGRPRTITIESPVNGAETYSSVQIKGSVDIAPFENNLTYRIFDVGGVELAVGAITVDAPNPGAPGTFDEVISLGRILSGAAIRIEVQDINAEDGSLFAMDSVELVVK